MSTPHAARAALLQAVFDRPDDDGPRHALADWLAEQGDAHRAEFIRLQCQLARLGEDDPARHGLFLRQSHLLAQHAAAWLGHVPDAVTAWFERGLVAATLRLRDLLDGPPAWLSARLSGREVGRLHLDSSADPDGHSLPAETVRADLARLAAWPDRALLPPLGLDLAEVRLADQDLAPLTGLPGLVELDLHGTGAADPALAILAGLGRLEALWLGWTSVTDAGLAHLRGLQRLTELDLSQTTVTAAGLAHVGRLTGLRWLALSGTPVRDLVPLARLPLLEGLYLAQTVIGDAALAVLPQLPRLRRLDLSGTAVTDAAAAPLAALPQLRLLNVARTAVTPAGVAALRQALPGCRVLS